MLVKKFLLVELIDECFLTNAELNNHYNDMSVSELNIKSDDKRVLVGSYNHGNDIYDTEELALTQLEKISSDKENVGKIYSVIPIFSIEDKK